MLRASVILLLISALAGCAGGETGHGHLLVTRAIRLQGAVYREPVPSVCAHSWGHSPCDDPSEAAGGARLMFTASTGAIRSFVVPKSGSYSFSLPAGEYTVTAVGKLVTGRTVDASTMIVRDWHDRNVNFRINTGLRCGGCG